MLTKPGVEPRAPRHETLIFNNTSPKNSARGTTHSIMRPWPLLLLAASSDARCGCDRRVIVATTVNGVRTASLLVPSAARVGAALVVYHEDSADAAAGLEPTEPRARRDAPACFVEAAGCYAAHDLHVLYPWLAAFADAQDPTEGPATVFGRAYANAVARRGAPRHATHLTAKAHFIFRKVAAIRHAAEAGARDASVDVVAWADADIAAYAREVQQAESKIKLPGVRLSRPIRRTRSMYQGDPEAPVSFNNVLDRTCVKLFVAVSAIRVGPRVGAFRPD